MHVLSGLSLGRVGSGRGGERGRLELGIVLEGRVNRTQSLG